MQCPDCGSTNIGKNSKQNHMGETSGRGASRGGVAELIYETQILPSPAGEGTRFLALLSCGRGVGGEGNSYLHSATPERLCP